MRPPLRHCWLSACTSFLSFRVAYSSPKSGASWDPPVRGAGEPAVPGGVLADSHRPTQGAPVLARRRQDVAVDWRGTAGRPRQALRSHQLLLQVTAGVRRVRPPTDNATPAGNATISAADTSQVRKPNATPGAAFPNPSVVAGIALGSGSAHGRSKTATTTAASSFVGGADGQGAAANATATGQASGRAALAGIATEAEQKGLPEAPERAGRNVASNRAMGDIVVVDTFPGSRTSWNPLELGGRALLWFAAVMGLVVVAMAPVAQLGGVSLAFWRRSSGSSSLCCKVGGMRVAGAKEIKCMFGGINSSNEHLAKFPLHTGNLTRVQARVKATPGNALTAPFSGRQCVSYSASVSQRRHDSVHPPPLAFHKASTDFLLEVASTPPMLINVAGQDVSLFDMSDGLQVTEQAFVSAPNTWRGFVLAHLVPSADATAHFNSCAELSPEGAPLEFRESALLVGSTVTCVGEMVRDANGRLCLQPLRSLPPQTEEALEQAPVPSKRSKSWLSRAVSWLAFLHRSRELSKANKEGLIGHVMVSDQPSLVGKAALRAQWWLDIPDYV